MHYLLQQCRDNQSTVPEEPSKSSKKRKVVSQHVGKKKVAAISNEKEPAAVSKSIPSVDCFDFASYDESQLDTSYLLVDPRSSDGSTRVFGSHESCVDSYSMYSQDYPEHHHVDDEDVLAAEGQSACGQRISNMTPRERRRERNKVLARKTRVKKKVELEHLRAQVAHLQDENRKLLLTRHVMTLEATTNCKIPKLIRGELLKTTQNQHYDVLTRAVESMQRQIDNSITMSAEKLLRSNRTRFCVVNHRREGTPIVFASIEFAEMTGFAYDDVLGRKFDFIFAENQINSESSKLFEAINCGQEVSVPLLLCCADRTQIWSHVFVSPVFNPMGSIALYIVVYVEAPGFPIYEHQENSSCVANDDFHKKQFHGGHSESSECGSTDESSDTRNTDSSENQDHSSEGDSNENGSNECSDNGYQSYNPFLGDLIGFNSINRI